MDHMNADARLCAAKWLKFLLILLIVLAVGLNVLLIGRLKLLADDMERLNETYIEMLRALDGLTSAIESAVEKAQ